MKQFKDRLKIIPYPGTLNVEVDILNVKRIRRLFQPITIFGFQGKDRSFGALHCYCCKINNKHKGYIVFAERTTHPPGIIEVISETYLRDKVKEKVKIEVFQV
jgi:CTP-dependent riboflavin kinase